MDRGVQRGPTPEQPLSEPADHLTEPSTRLCIEYGERIRDPVGQRVTVAAQRRAGRELAGAVTGDQLDKPGSEQAVGTEREVRPGWQLRPGVDLQLQTSVALAVQRH